MMNKLALNKETLMNRIVISCKNTFLLNFTLLLFAFYVVLPATPYYLPQLVRYGLNALMIASTVLSCIMCCNDKRFYFSFISVLVLIFLLYFSYYSSTGVSFLSFFFNRFLFFIPFFLFVCYSETKFQPNRFVVNIVKIIFLFAMITTIVGNSKYPQASRLLAGGAAEEESAFYFKMNIGGYGFVYSCVFFYLFVLYDLKRKSILNKLFNISYIIVTWIMTVTTEYTIAIIILFFVTVGFFLINPKRIRSSLFLILVLVLLFFVFKDLLSKLLYSLGNYLTLNKQLFIGDRVVGISSIISGRSLTGDTYNRILLYNTSWEAFKNSPALGNLVAFNELGGHSELFDTLGLIGFLGFSFFIFIMVSYYSCFTTRYFYEQRGVLIVSAFAFLIFFVADTVFSSAEVGFSFFLIPLFSCTSINRNEQQ